MKLLTDWMLQERDAAHVPGSVPRIGGLIVVLEQLAKIWGQELFMVALNRGIETRRDKRGRVSEEVNIFVNLLDNFEREFGNQGAIRNQEDRDLLVAVADVPNNFKSGALFELRFAFEVPVQQDGGIAGIGSHERKAIFG
jgi:hypothetical protein